MFWDHKICMNLTAARGQDCTTPSLGTQIQLHIQVPEERWKSEATFDLTVGET